MYTPKCMCSWGGECATTPNLPSTRLSNPLRAWKLYDKSSFPSSPLSIFYSAAFYNPYLHVKRTSWGQLPTALGLEGTGSSLCTFLTCCITHTALTETGAFRLTLQKSLMMYVGDRSANGPKWEKFSGILYAMLSYVLHK